LSDQRASNGERMADIVIRLDERTANMARDMAELRQVIVTQPEFKPVKAVVYGLVGIVLTAVIVALVALVIQSG
jgi:hypothetical protein